MDYSLFTDGGCRSNGENNSNSGLGCLFFNNQKTIILKYNEKLDYKPNTNNKAEIVALIRGLEIANYYCSNNFEFNNINVYLDSAYVLNGITKWIINWKNNDWINSNRQPVKNKKLWQRLDFELTELNKIANINFNKVKGHSGIYENEVVDKLANKAMDNDIEIKNINKNLLKKLKEAINE